MKSSQFLTDHGVVPTLEGDAVVALPYCDNIHTASTSSKAAVEAARVIAKHFRSLGFGVHEEFGPVTEKRSLGYLIQGDRWRLTPYRERLQRTVAAWRYIEKCDKLAGFQLERVLAHTIHHSMLRPELLSIFRATYDFINNAITMQRLCGPP